MILTSLIRVDRCPNSNDKEKGYLASDNL